jgi:hypothetical protein
VLKHTEAIDMETQPKDPTEELISEINQTPEEYRPLLLRIVRSFREGVILPSAETSFKAGWRDAMEDNTKPVDTLRDDIDAN